MGGVIISISLNGEQPQEDSARKGVRVGPMNGGKLGARSVLSAHLAEDLLLGGPSALFQSSAAGADYEECWKIVVQAERFRISLQN